MRTPALARQLFDFGLEPCCIQFQRGKFSRDSRIQFLGRFHAFFVQVLRLRGERIARLFCSRLQRIELRLAALNRVKLAAHLAHFIGQIVHITAMLARQGPQFKQPGFGRIQGLGIMHQSIGRIAQFILCLARLDHGPIKCRQGLCQNGMLSANPVQLARSKSQRGERRIRPLPNLSERFQIAGQTLSFLHIRTRLCEPQLLA